MAYDERQNSDHGWSKPRLKPKKQGSAEGKTAKVGGDKDGSPSSGGGGLKAKIRARREQEQLKDVSQGIKARSKAFNRKQEEKAVQEEVGAEAVGKKRPTNKRKFKSNKLFGITLLAPGLDECDPEGVAALDGTLAAYLGQTPAASQPVAANESCSARHPAPGEAEPLPMAAPSAMAAPIAPAPAQPAAAPADNVSAPPSLGTPPVAAPLSPLRPYKNRPHEVGAEPEPYIPERRSAVAPPAVAQAQPYASSGNMPDAAALSQPEPSGAAAKLQLAIPTSPLRPYRGPSREVASERTPYIPGVLHPAASAPSSLSAAPNFGTGTASVYSAPVSAAHLGSSASKNTVLPLPVGRGHKAAAQKNKVLHEEGGSYRSSARANSSDNFGAQARENANIKNNHNQETIPPAEEETETATEGKSLIELLESVPVAKRKGPSRYV